MHPRLIHTLVLLDPVIQQESTQIDPVSLLEAKKTFIAKTTQLSTYRRDLWPSRKAAAEGFKRSPFYQAWDPRVLDRWIKYGLRDLPTAIHPLPDKDKNNTKDGNQDEENRPVTLATTLHQEVFTFSRPNYDSGKDKPINRVTHPDLNPNQFGSYPFYRPEPARIFAQLPHLRPSVLYIFAGKSDLSLPDLREAKLAETGTGLGGSGGVPAGRVRGILFEEKGHLLAQEAVHECADAAGDWLRAELGRWRDEDRAFWEKWARKSRVEKLTIDEEWKRNVPLPEERKKASSKL